MLHTLQLRFRQPFVPLFCLNNTKCVRQSRTNACNYYCIVFLYFWPSSFLLGMVVVVVSWQTKQEETLSESSLFIFPESIPESSCISPSNDIGMSSQRAFVFEGINRSCCLFWIYMRCAGILVTYLLSHVPEKRVRC